MWFIHIMCLLDIVTLLSVCGLANWGALKFNPRKFQNISLLGWFIWSNSCAQWFACINRDKSGWIMSCRLRARWSWTPCVPQPNICTAASFKFWVSGDFWSPCRKQDTAEISSLIVLKYFLLVAEVSVVLRANLIAESTGHLLSYVQFCTFKI